ncbi:MAG TPA: hypothetical protein PKA79_00720 [Oligoflexia bacterium]|nr:hypothetical protein [Oligoflexia bacterium]
MGAIDKELARCESPAELAFLNETVERIGVKSLMPLLSVARMAPTIGASAT